MILKDITLENFGPYRERTVVELAPTDRPGVRPVVLIGALNGSGKTSLLDALLLALYGSRARCSTRKNLSYQSFLRESINNRAPQDATAVVSVAFDTITSKGRSELRVTRSWRLAGKTIAERCEVDRNGAPDVELSETWAERVEGIVPLGISSLFFFDGEQVKSLAAEEEPPEEVKAAIRTLLNIDLAEQLQEDLRLISARRRKTLAKAPEQRARLEDADQRYESASRMSQDLAIRCGELKNALEDAERAYAAEKDRFISDGGSAASDREELQKRLAKTKASIDAVRDRLRDLAAGALPLALIQPLLKAAEQRGELEVRARSEAGLSQMFDTRDEQVVKEFVRSGAPKQAVDLLGKVLAADRAKRFVKVPNTRNLRSTTPGLANLKRAYVDLHDQAAPKAREALREIHGHEVEAQKLEAQLAVAENQEGLIKALERLTRAQVLLENLRAQHNSAMEALAQAQRQSEIAAGELAKVRAEQNIDFAALDEDARIVRAAERVVDVMGEFRVRLLRRKVQELERNICERFVHLHRKKDAIERVEIDPNTFRLRLFDPEGRPVNRDRMSAGEQQLLAVAFLWGLALSSNRQLPILVDTPLARMDHTHRRNLVERYFPMASHQVILLSTDAEIEQQYQQALHEAGAIDREYRLEFDQVARQTRIQPGYFWSV